ncbi:MAG: heat-inducible transcriptional repressor HrcA [Candidatus Latescibacterota bacterium]|mgnify:CR=1 FL=1|jgi:heat-inducible transcriptional repressor
METKSISSREIQVLQALVRAHIALGVPVGSRTLGESYSLGVSPATIRNALASLEEKGYVHQPHTSAGRVPTERGYRFYVTQCMAEEALELDAGGAVLRRELEAQLCEGDMQEIMAQLAHIIGDVSKQLGLVLAPRFEQGVLGRIELVSLAENRLLLVVSINQGLMKSLVIEVGSGLSREDLETMNRLLNERLYGLNLAEIRHTVRERLRNLEERNPQLLRAVVDEIEALAQTNGDLLYVSGTSNLCLQPEFGDSLRVAGLVDLAEKKNLLAHLMSERRGVVVTIGEDHPLAAMRHCGMVTASYEVEGGLGVIGIIGPTRMPYESLVTLVNYAALRAAQLVC